MCLDSRGQFAGYFNPDALIEPGAAKTSRRIDSGGAGPDGEIMPHLAKQIRAPGRIEASASQPLFSLQRVTGRKGAHPW